MNSTQQWQNVTWFEVDEHQDGQRIDNFLFSRLKGVPKSRIYRLIREGQVRVNKKRIKPEYKLCVGDEIRVPPVRVSEENELPSSKLGSVQALAHQIIYEDEAIIVLNKPSGLAVHGGSGRGGACRARSALQGPGDRFRARGAAAGSGSGLPPAHLQGTGHHGHHLQP